MTNEQLLARINAELPPGIDWRAGALRYVRASFEKRTRAFYERFSCTKPLNSIGADDNWEPLLAECVHYLQNFVNMVALLKMPPASRWLTPQPASPEPLICTAQTRRSLRGPVDQRPCRRDPRHLLGHRFQSRPGRPRAGARLGVSMNHLKTSRRAPICPRFSRGREFRKRRRRRHCPPTILIALGSSCSAQIGSKTGSSRTTGSSCQRAKP